LLRAVGAGFMASSAVVLLWPAGAGAAAPDAKGWWYRPQQSGTPVAIPAPPVVPAGGLYVAQGPNNENLAVAAVEYRVIGPGTSTLTLKPAAGTVGTVAVTACPLSAGFTPADAGPWDQAPAYNCTSAAVDGVAAPDGSLVFALTADFVAAGATAVQAALVPTPGSAPFQVPIEAPGDGSFVAVAAPAGETPAADTSAPSSSDSSFADPSFDTGGSVGAFPGDSGTASPAPTSSPTPEVALRPSVRRPRPVVPVAASRQLGDRVAAVVALALIGAAMWFLGGRPLPSPRLLGGASSGDTAVVETPAALGGIGRFARPRDARPNRL
jgi:hypothetical protein